MAGNFVKRKALRLLASAVREQMPYIANAESLFPQETMKGKKYGPLGRIHQHRRLQEDHR